MSGRQIKGSVALVTGANRGLGRAIAEALLERGAARVYAGARRVDSVAGLEQQHGDRVIPVQLDVTDGKQVAAVAAAADGVDLLVNNAGVAAVPIGSSLAADDMLDGARDEMEVNYFGVLRLTQAFAPVLGANGGGAIVNIASIAGLTNFPLFPTYSASKAAVRSLTQASRVQLRPQGTEVYGVYPGPVDTDMAEELPMDKATPDSVANAILDGIESGQLEIYPDPTAVQFGDGFETSPAGLEHQVAQMGAETPA